MVRILRIALLPILLSFTVMGCATRPAGNIASTQVSDQAAVHAKSMIGTRYRYGGSHPGKGFDCSGLIYYSYKKAGANVPRTTKSQYRASRPVSLDRLRRGDLLFFNQEGKRSSHVAIYVGNNRFVHAPSSGKRVRMDSLSSRYWRRHLASARRFN